MLDQKDLQAIAELIDARITKTEEKVTSLETRINDVERNLTNELVRTEEKVASLEARINDVERNLTNELVRTEDKLCRRIARVEKSIEEFKGYFKLERKDNEGVDLTVRLRKVANC